MTLINNHVHISMLKTVTANTWSLRELPCALTIRRFGLAPKYEISPAYAIVVSIEPKSGFFALLFSWIRPKKTLYTVSEENLSTWRRLYPLYWTLSNQARAIYIQKKRVDTLTITHTISEGGTPRTFKFRVNLRATVNPERFYTFLFSNAATPDILLETLQNRIAEEIEHLLSEQFNNPTFITHCKIEDKLLDEASYIVEDCRIQYIS